MSGKANRKHGRNGRSPSGKSQALRIAANKTRKAKSALWKSTTGKFLLVPRGAARAKRRLAATHAWLLQTVGEGKERLPLSAFMQPSR